MTVVVSSTDFVVTEQIKRSAYIAHVFTDREQFVSWRQDHPWMTITDPQMLDELLDALDTNLQVTLKLACIPEYELHFHLRDGTVQTFGYSCHGASFIRGEQGFWAGEDYAPPEQFDALIKEQLALNPRELIPASIKQSW